LPEVAVGEDPVGGAAKETAFRVGDAMPINTGVGKPQVSDVLLCLLISLPSSWVFMRD